VSLEALFDGWVSHPVAGEDFLVPADVELGGDSGSSEDLAFGESSDPIIDWATPNNWVDPERLPGQHEEMAWSGLNLCLGSLSEIIGGKRKAYQENFYSPDKRTIIERKYTFQFIPGETGFKGGRL
jgi:hypothetical protein